MTNLKPLDISGSSEINLSFYQRRSWFFSQYQNEVDLLESALFAVRFKGNLNKAAIVQAFINTVNRHDILRTTYHSQEGGVVSKVHPKFSEIVTLSDTNETCIEKIINLDLQQTFKLHQGPLFLARLVTISETDHLLVVSVHSIIFDFHVLNSILQEIKTEYQAYKKSKLFFHKQYTQYQGLINAQRHQIHTEKLEKNIEFWRKELDECPRLNFPLDFPRSANKKNRSELIRFHLDNESSLRLKKLAAQFKTQLYIVLVAAINIFLNRYTTQEDIVLGTQHDNFEDFDCIGPLQNTLLLRNKFSTNTIFHDFLRQVSKSERIARRHNSVPLELLLDTLSPDRIPGLSPFFQVLFVYTSKLEKQKLDFHGVDAEIVYSKNSIMDIDFAFYIDESENGLDGYIQYNLDMFVSSRIESMVANFQNLLHHIPGSAHGKICEIPLICPDEYAILLKNLNDTYRAYPKHACVHQAFENIVKTNPDKIALIFENEALTYEQLNGKANQLAHYLRSLGVLANTYVAISIERSFELIIGLLGILKAGGAYVALEPHYPAERLEYMLKNSDTKILLTQEKQKDNYNYFNNKLILIDSDWHKIKKYPQDNPKNLSNVEDSAFVLYTSGSTGKPKGVIGNHHSILNRTYWMWEQFPYQSEEICCLKTALSSAPSIWDIFQPLLFGIKLVILPSTILQSPHQLIDLLARHEITRLGVVPTLLRVILEQNPNLEKRLPRLKFWEVGGEAISSELARLFLDTCPNAQLINRYGATEAISILDYDISGSWDKRLAAVPIGKPIANTKAYVLDEYMNLVPYGAIGTLYICSRGLAKGYINQVDLTAKMFVSNPFLRDSNQESDHRLYNTGDLVSWLPNKALALHGRQDYQIDIRGFRVELEEIQTALQSHPDIKHSLVIGEGVDDVKYLVAYYVPALPGGDIPTEKLRIYLSQMLIEYMVPTVFMALDQFPLLPNGKIDRKALPKVGKSLLLNKYFPPRSRIERELLKVWQELFLIVDVGMADDFFLMGGNSILVMKLVYKIYNIFNINLPVSSFFTNKTIESQALLIKHYNSELNYYQPVVKISCKNTEKNVFFAPPAGGSSFRYHKLQTYLNNEFTLFGMESPNLNLRSKKILTIEDLATFYLAEIRKIQPKGPYHLGGWSHGGLVSYEITQQLNNLGEEVSLLFMIDTYAVKNKIKNIADIMDAENLAKILIKSNVFPMGCEQNTIDLMVRNFKISAQSIQMYKIKPYKGNLVLLKAEDTSDEDNPDDLAYDSVENNGWSEFINGDIYEHIIPGSHNNLMLENAHLIASYLTQYMVKSI